MIGIVVSRADEASEHVGEHLLALREWDESRDDDRPDGAGGGTVYRAEPFELRTFDELHLHLDGVAAAFDEPDMVAFASRHSGETGPLLTAHFTGNFGPAEFGGEAGDLATAAPAALDVVVAAFDEHAPEGYDVGVECTHHGPSAVGAPSLFVEVGSAEPQWADPDAARAVARAILALEELAGGGDVDPLDARTVVGFGGGHYAPRFDRIRRETGWAVGHVAADWALDAMGDPTDERDVLRQAFEASAAEHALVDGDEPELVAVVEDLGYRVVGETWLREVDGVPLPFADAVEDAIGRVEDGLRFGDPARVNGGGRSTVADGRDGPAEGDEFVDVSLPDDLLDEASAVDADRTLAAVRETVLAYETEEHGNRPRGRAAVRDDADKASLVDRLIEILEPRYESVERDGDDVLIRERTFDPELARELGVPEGPKFGRLADGRPVEVDGETIRPTAVTREERRRVRID